MGCTSSKFEDSEVVLRCKNRKRMVKQAVEYRHDFAMAHIAYLQALGSLGIALRHFAEGGSADVQGSPTTVFSPPESSSLSSTAAVSPYPQASIVLSSPSPPPYTVTSPLPSKSPPPLSTQSPSATEVSSSAPPPLDLGPPRMTMSKLISMPTIFTEYRFASPERSTRDSPPRFLRQEDTDDLYMTFVPPPPTHISLNPLPPPSPPRNSAWDFLDLFHPPPIPFHLQEQRNSKQVEEVEEEPQDLVHLKEEEGIPSLEEEKQKDEEKEQEHKEKVFEKVQSEEKADSTAPEEILVKVAEIDEEEVPESVKEKETVLTMKSVAALVMEEEKVKTEKMDGGNENTKNVLVSVPAWIGKNLIEAVRYIEDQFVRAYGSGKDVSRILETQRVQHHLSFSDLKDTAKVFNAITWHWSKKTPLALLDASDDSEMAEYGMTGSHASTLERLYAWERKLYEEVKTSELIRMAFDKKCAQLRSLDAKGEDHIVIDKTRASIKSLDTQLIVALHAIHSVSLRIQMLADEELYPQLAELLRGLGIMWRVMLDCHKTQHEISMEMKSLYNAAAADEASEAHRKATVELENELNNWQNCFSRWITSQQCYIDSLLSWLTLCHLQPEKDAKGRNVSPYWVEDPPIFALIRDWLKALKHLDGKSEVVDGISNFATVVHSLQVEQSEELRQKKRAEGFAKDLDQKTLSLQNLEKKYVESPDSDDKQDLNGVRSTARNNIQERRAALNSFRNRVEEEKQKHFKVVQHRRETTLSILKRNLPSIFEAMSSFAAAAVEEYRELQQHSEKVESHPSEYGELP